jgi:hypothetical protein
MKNTIIAIYGRQNEGKSETIKMVCKMLLDNFSDSKLFPDTEEVVDFSSDINVIVKVGDFKIGIESQGDPDSRMINEDTVKKLAEKGCQIILCATRTRGDTVKEVDKIANNYNYYTLWKSSYYAPGFDHKIIDRICAEEIVGLIKSLIVEEI